MATRTARGLPGRPGRGSPAGYPRARNGGGNGRGGDGRGRGGRGGRPHQKGDWWRRWTWKKAIGLSLATGAGFFILVLVGVFYMYARTPIPAASSFATGQASRVYFRDGKTLVGMFGSTNRQILSSNQIPTMVKHAMVAAEDKHFYDEGGISPTGIIRAGIADLTSGSVQQGGSTITQELVRNYYLGIGDSETATRKIKEIFVAEKLASQESKDWILTNYMNTVPTGVGHLRLRRRRPAVLRRAGQQADRGPGRDDRGHAAGAGRLQPEPVGWRRLHEPGVPLALRAEHHGPGGLAVPEPGQRAEVPQAGEGVQQLLVRVPRLHHGSGAERAGEHLPLHPGRRSPTAGCASPPRSASR